MRYKFLQKSVLAVVLASLATTSVNAQSGTDWSAWSKGYESYEKSRTARVKGDYDEALKLLERAKGYYLQVKESRPDWNQKVIDSRITMVDNDIALLKRLQSGEPIEDISATIESNTASTTSSRLSSRQVKELQVEVEQYKLKVAELVSDLEVAKANSRTATASSNEMSALVRENKQLLDQITALRRQISNLEQQLAEPDIELSELRNRLVEEKISAETALKRVELIVAENQRIRTETAEAYQERNQLRVKVQDLNTRIRAMERELNSLRDTKSLSEAERTNFTNQLATKSEEVLRLTKAIESRDKVMAKLNEQYTQFTTNPDSAKVELANTLKENLSLSEQIVNLTESRDSLQTKVNQLEDLRRQDAVSITELRESIYNNQQLITAMEDELVAARRQMDQDLGQITDLTAQKSTLEERNSKLEGDVITLSGNAEQLKKRLDAGSDNVQAMIDLNSRNRDLYTKLATAESEADRLRQDVKIYETKLVSLSVELEDAKVNGKNAEANEALANELKETKTKIAELNVDLENYKNDSEAALRIANEKLTSLPELQKSLADEQKKNQELNAQITNLKKSAAEQQAVNAQLQKLVLEKEELAQELEAANNMLDKLKTSADTATSETLKAELNKLNSERVAQQNALDALRREAQQQDAKKMAEKQATEIEKLLLAAQNDNDVKAQITAHFAGAGEAEDRQAIEVAMYHYRKILELKPNDFAATRRLGLLEYSRGNLPVASELMLATLTEQPGDPEVASCYATMLLKENKAGNAEAVLNAALAVAPENYQLWLLHSSALAATGDIGRAENELVKLIADAPQKTEAYTMLAELIARNYAERLGEAAELYITAKDLGGEMNGYLEESLQDYLQDNSETIDFLISVALEAEKSQDWESAMWFYREWCDLEPTRALPHYRLAWTLLMQDKKSEAISTLSDGKTATAVAIKLLALPPAEAVNLVVGELDIDTEDMSPVWSLIDAQLVALPKNSENDKIRAKIEKIRP